MARKPQTKPTPNVPRTGFEQRWADLCDVLSLSETQKTWLEEFMSDLQDDAHRDGQHSMMPQ